MKRKIYIHILITMLVMNNLSFAFCQDILSPQLQIQNIIIDDLFKVIPSEKFTQKLDVSLLENVHQAVKTIEIKFKHDYPGFLHKIIKAIDKHGFPLRWYQMVKKRDGTFSFRLDVTSANGQVAALVDELRLMDDIFDSEYESIDFICRKRILELNFKYKQGSLSKITEFLAENYINVSCFLTPIIDPSGDSFFTFEIDIPRWLTDEEVRKNLQCSLNCEDNNVYLNQGTLIDAVIDRCLSHNIKKNINRDYLKNTLSVMIRHLSQSRKDKRTPFIMHQIEVVNILLDRIEAPQKNRLLLQEMITAAILHDAIEDGDIDDENLKKQFGENVYNIVSLLTNRRTNGDKDELKYLRKILEAKGIWVLIAKIIKIADRIHNIQTLDIGNPEFERRIFFSTIDEFIPEFVSKIKIDPEDVAGTGIDIAVWQQVLENAKSELNKEIHQVGKQMDFLDSQGKIYISQWRKYILENKDDLVELINYSGISKIIENKRIQQQKRHLYSEITIQSAI